MTEQQREDDDEPGISVNPHAPHVEDAHRPLPGPLKRVDGKRNPSMVPKAIRGGKERYLAYGRYLVANGGNRAFALRDLFGLDHDPNASEEAELHQRLIAEAGKDIPLKQTLDYHDLSEANIAAVVAAHMYSDHPAASLKGVEIARDMRAKAGSATSGATFEDFLSVARERVRAESATEE